MAMMVVLLPTSDRGSSLRTAALRELVRLGITRVFLVGDDRSLGVVVEGWAFDPSRSARHVVSALAGQDADTRILQPIAELAVSHPAIAGGDQGDEAAARAPTAPERAAPE